MSASNFQYRIGYTLPATHSVHRHLVAAVERITQATDGVLRIQPCPHESWGTDAQMLDGVFSGALEFNVVTGPYLGRRVAQAALSAMPFAFADHDAVWQALDGPLGSHIRRALQAAGLHAFDKAFDNGFRHLTTLDRTVTGPQHVRGLRMRVVAAPLYESLWQCLGARTQAIDIVDVRAALERGDVEAQDNPLPVIQAFGLHEVQRHCALSHHVWDGYWITANLTRWQALPVQVQHVVADAFEQAAVEQRLEQAQAHGRLLEELQAAGLRFNPIDRPAFRQALADGGFYAHWRDVFGHAAWQLLHADSMG